MHNEQAASNPMSEAVDKVREMENTIVDVEALLEGCVRLLEACDCEHAVGLAYIALEKIQSLG